MRRIAVLNQEGGVGKTTSTVNLAAALAADGNRTLVLDLDPQAHATLHLGLLPGRSGPSLYDGFGMPVLEAMEQGVPVVAARAGAPPEIAGDAAVMVEPHDAEAFADGVSRVAGEEALRSRLVAAGRQRAAQFSWDKAASEVLDVYHRLAG